LAYACIDVGSNTTRLLVADAEDGRLRELVSQRAFTRIGRSLAGKSGPKRIPLEKLDETAEVVSKQTRVARELGAGEVVVVATAAIRQARNSDELAAAVEELAGVPLRILSDEEEARLSFVGATKTLGAPPDGPVGVVDVGGGSTEVVVGTVPGGVSWFASFRIGSGFLADSYLRSDPPSVSELHAVRQHVAGCFEGLEIPPRERSVAVGGSATSLRRLVGAELAYETLERGIRILSTTPVAEVAARFELEPERVRLLPAGILVFEELSERLGAPLQIGKGGLREGVVLELIERDQSAEARTGTVGA
jgi:exopolyphosphatase/guanosine-5'-triphosphate,3'-diphosphate pyrophosphatase